MARLWESTSAVFLHPVCRLLRVIYKALWLIMPRRIICKTAWLIMLHRIILQNSVVNNAAQNISTANIRMQDSVVEKLKSQTTDKPASSQKEYTLDEIKEFRKNPDISELFFIIETYLKHTLSSTDTNMVLYWLDELHFLPTWWNISWSTALPKGHSSLRYMNKVALGWADAGIKTVDQAKDDAAAHSTDLLFCNEGSRHHRPQSG